MDDKETASTKEDLWQCMSKVRASLNELSGVWSHAYNTRINLKDENKRMRKIQSDILTDGKELLEKLEKEEFDL